MLFSEGPNWSKSITPVDFEASGNHTVLNMSFFLRLWDWIKNMQVVKDVSEYHTRKCNEKSSQTILKIEAMLE